MYGSGTKWARRLGALSASIAESRASGRDDTAPGGSSSITSERALASLWQRVHTLTPPVRLETRDGARFRVIYPGTSNLLAGPDFRNAVVASDDGRVIRGDVELHLRAPDWYSHGHDSDPNYNGVILHVVLVSKGDSTSAQQSGLAAPIAEITPQGRADEPADTPYRSVEDMGGVLDRAGDERFFHRSRGYALEMRDANPDQILYEALMEALGYSANRKPFRQLARRVPASLLAGLRGEPPATRRRAFEALLIQAAGMTSYVQSDERAPEWRALSRLLPRLRPMPSSEWHLFRVRPANHPVRRITGAAHLFNEHVERGLVSSIAGMIREGGPASLIEGFTAPGSIGRGRAADMAVNAALPAMHAYARIRGEARLEEKCVGLYRRFPRAQDNDVTREMERLLGVGKAVVNGARRQQGLHQLYRRMTLGIRE